MSEIKPALTAEEWIEGFDAGHGFDFPGATFERDGQMVEIKPHGEEENPGRWITLTLPVDGARVAALCLHEQPFGFTQEDVDGLRIMMQREGPRIHMYGSVATLADRIEALLPPEEK